MDSSTGLYYVNCHKCLAFVAVNQRLTKSLTNFFQCMIVLVSSLQRRCNRKCQFCNDLYLHIIKKNHKQISHLMLNHCVVHLFLFLHHIFGKMKEKAKHFLMSLEK